MRAPSSPPTPGAARAAARTAAAATAGVLSVAIAAAVAWKSAALIALVLLAILVAIPLNRAVEALSRARLPRSAGIALVVAALVAALVALSIYVVRPAAVQVAQLVAAAPELIDGLRRSRWLAALARALGDAGLLEKLRDTAPALAQDLVGRAFGAASGVAGGLSALATVLVTAVLLLASGPSLLPAALALARPERRPRWRELGLKLEAALGAYLTGLAVIVAARALATAAFLASMDVPFYLPLALLAAVSVLVPYVGAAVRFLAILAVVFAARGAAGTFATLVFLVAYDTLESYLLSPLVYRRAVSLSPLVQFLAVLFLGYHAGVVGAILALPLAATVQTVLAEVLRWRGQRQT